MPISIMISEDSSDEFDSKTQSSSSSSGMHYGYTRYLGRTLMHNSYIIDENDILIPLEDIAIPPEYLLPEFQEQEKKSMIFSVLAAGAWRREFETV